MLAQMVAPTVTELPRNQTAKIPGVRPEDVFFLEDGLKNLVARVLKLAVDDAQAIGEKQDGKGERALMHWVYSDRFELWSMFVGVDAQQLEARICQLVDGESDG